MHCSARRSRGRNVGVRRSELEGAKKLGEAKGVSQDWARARSAIPNQEKQMSLQDCRSRCRVCASWILRDKVVW